jgi:hypothetical protein
MSKKWVKIDRSTGNVIKAKSAAKMERVFNKPTVWLELVREASPDFDSNTQKIVAGVRQSDLSDLAVDVDPSEKHVEIWEVISLSAEELEQRTKNRINATDYLLAKIVEDLMVAIATGASLTRDTFPAAVWDQINARRLLRGEDDV